MPIGRDRRCRLVVTASLLLGLLGALLGCLGGTAAAAPGVFAGADRDAAAVPAATLGPGQSQGCGKGVDDADSGAHPGTPPRGGSAYELLPALHETGCSALPAVPDSAFLDASPLPASAPLAPPSPVDLSVLRV